MATASTAPEPQQQAQLQSSRTLFQGLLVGSVLLLLYSLWLKVGQPDLTMGVSLVVWGFVAAGVALGLWHFLALQRARRGGVDELVRQRRLIGLIIVAAGIVLLLVGGYLGFQLGLQGLGESLGLLLFALFLLLSGLCYWQPIQTTGAGILNTLSQNYGLVRVVLFLLGLVTLGLFIWLVSRANFRADYVPEIVGLAYLTVMFIGGGLWLSMSPERRTPDGFRVFLLVIGGQAGFIITLEAALRSYLWRQDVFFGGISVWQGEMGYRIWICAYIALVGLVLMFGSVLLARGDIRTSPELRYVLFGYNLIFTTLLLLAFLVVFNVAFYAMFPLTFEWTKTRGLTSLSGATKNLLKGLKEPTTVYVLLPQNHPIFNDMRAMLGNSQVQSDKLQVKYVSPDRDFGAFEDLARRFPELLPSARVARLDGESGRGVLIVYGSIPEDLKVKVPHTFVPMRKLFEEGGFHGKGAKPTRIFKGELEVMREINFLVNGQKQRKIYFLQGNGELDVANREFARFRDPRADMSQLGVEGLFERLKKDNYDPQGLSFDRPGKEKEKDKSNVVYAAESGPEKRKEVPEDAWAVVVAGPSKDLPPDALDALQRYMDRGGKLLATVDIVLDGSLTKLKKSNFDDFLKKYGVIVEEQYVMQLPAPGEDPRIARVRSPLNSTNELAKQFWNLPFDFKTVRVVRPDPKATKYKGEVFLQAGLREEPVLEVDVATLRNPIAYLQALSQKGQLIDKLAEQPLPTAVVVSEDGAKPRLVVFGDSEFISNTDLRISDDAHYGLFVSSLEWMADRGGFIGPMPKETPSYVLPGNVQLSRLVLLPGWFMFLGIFGLGLSIWIVRRR